MKSKHPVTDEALARIEKKHTHAGLHNVTTNWKAAFIELGFEMVEMEDKLQHPTGIRHGVDCEKVPHGEGMMHGPDDDAPYSVDGLLYCGRCHHFIKSR